jgi:hypothetical protein
MGNIQRKGMNVHWQIGVSLEATLEEGRTCECPWVDSRAVAVLLIEFVLFTWVVVLVLRATFFKGRA